MLNDVLETFKKKIKKDGEDFIFDNLVLAKGTYVIVSSDKKSYEVYNITGEDDKETIGPELYKKICKMDYYSTLLTMNKAVDKKKTIHSNNYLSFFIKKENLRDNIVNDISSNKSIHVAIDRYYDLVKALVPKNTKNKDKKTKANEEEEIKMQMYKSLEKPLDDMDIKSLEANKSWIKENILLLRENKEYVDDKNYLKIFFDEPLEKYENESNRYKIPKIFNSTDYNVVVNDVIYGLSNNDMQLNSKKPSLKQATRKNMCPSLITLEDALLYDKFFTYLTCVVNNNQRYLYVDDEDFYEGIKNITKSKSTFNGYLLKLKKGMSGAEIKGFYTISGAYLWNLKKEFEYINYLDIDVSDEKKIPFGKIKTNSGLENAIDKILYNNALRKNYTNDDIKIKDPALKSLLISTKDSMFNWFKCGKDRNGYLTIKRYSADIIKNSIFNGYYNKAREQFNLIYSLESHYFERGETNMSNIIKDIKENLSLKINQNDEEFYDFFIESDEEYYFAIGQLASYFLSQKKSAKVYQSELNPILNSKNDEKLKTELKKMYEKYNHSIYFNYTKFKRLYALVVGYNPKSQKIDTNLIIGGFLYPSIIRKPKKDNQDELDSTNNKEMELM